MKKVGRPKTKKRELKKARCVRVSDDDIELIRNMVKSEKGFSLQNFIDYHLEKLK